MTRGGVRIAIAAVVLAVLAKGALFLFVVKSIYRGCGDPEDRFRVVQVVDVGSRSIVGVDYEHADSSARVMAFWIVSGQPPAVGSEEKVCGPPTAVWIGDRSAIAVHWNGKGQPVLVPAVKPARVVEGPFMTACYFGSGLGDTDSARGMLCYDASRVGIELPPG